MYVFIEDTILCCINQTEGLNLGQRTIEKTIEKQDKVL